MILLLFAVGLAFGVTHHMHASNLSNGWADIVACDLDTDAAIHAYKSYEASYLALQKTHPFPASDRILSTSLNMPDARGFHPPGERFELFGDEVLGLQTGGMHGTVWYFTFVKGDFLPRKELIEKKYRREILACGK